MSRVTRAKLEGAAKKAFDNLSDLDATVTYQSKAFSYNPASGESTPALSTK